LLMTARTPSGTAVPLVGMRGRWLADRLARASQPLVSGADRRAAFVSRCVSVAIAFLCLALAAGGIAKYVLPAL